MRTENDASANDRNKDITDELERLSKIIAGGEKKETLSNRILAAAFLALFSSGGYLAIQQPKFADHKDIEYVLRKRGESITRPDKWTGTMDRERMSGNTGERHREQSEMLKYVENRLQHKADRLATLERQIESLRDNLLEEIRARKQ